MNTINTPPVSPATQKQSSPDSGLLELEFNEDLGFFPLEEVEHEIVTTAEQEIQTTFTLPKETVGKTFLMISFKTAQQNDPSTETILKDLLPIRSRQGEQGLRVSKKNFEMFLPKIKLMRLIPIGMVGRKETFFWTFRELHCWTLKVRDFEIYWSFQKK